MESDPFFVEDAYILRVATPFFPFFPHFNPSIGLKKC
jgi:hypothetical protein